MRFVFKFKLFCLAFSLLVFFVFLTPAVNAGPSDNIRGWAWNNIYGWISFNSDDCSVVGGNYSGNPSGCPTTPYYSYGVKVDDLGNFSGYAWNNAVGWISFNRCGTDNICTTPNDGDTGDPPLAGEIARIEADGTTVTGWAKALSLGEDGWIRFDHGWSDPVTYDGASEEFSGWAYGGDTGMGWISFNCADYKACNEGANAGEICTNNSQCNSNFCDEACNLSPYKVYKNDGILPPATSGNVSGWAWNNNIGWISFSSIDCDVNGNGVFEGLSEGAPTGCPPSGPVVKYGVNINLVTGVFSGYAWNDKVGWIAFQKTDSDPPDNYAFNTMCDTGVTCDSTNDCTACYNSTDKNIYGWAKVLSMGDDGWIRFDHGQTGYEASVDLSVGALRGWAYNQGMGETGVGWISLNCLDGGSCDATCLANDTCSSDYRVIINFGTLSTVSEVQANNISEDLACSGSALVAKLSWKYEDDSGNDATAYRIQVFGGGEFDTGKCTGHQDCDGCDNPDFCTINFAGENSFCFEDGANCYYTLSKTFFSEMTYGASYSWSVTVWDSFGSPTTENGNSFTTYLSKFPNPDNFIWTPLEFNAGEEVYFESKEKAKYYTGSTENSCDEDNCSWEWSSPTDEDNIDFSSGDASASSTILTFKEAKELTIKLKVTDKNTNYSCASTTQPFNIKQKLPSWIETKTP